MQTSIQKTQQLTLFKKTLLISSLFLLGSVQAQDADAVGSITEHKGSGGITRQSGDTLPTGLDVGLLPMDFIETANGRLKAEFEEGSLLHMTEHTEATITKY